MRVTARAVLGLVFAAAAAAAGLGVLTRPSHADVQPGSYSLEVSAAATPVAVGSSFTVDVSILHADMPAYQAVQWGVDFDEMLVAPGALSPVASIRDASAPNECSNASSNGLRVALGCIDIFGANLTYSGVVWHVPFTCLAPGTASFTLMNETETPNAMTFVRIGVAYQPVHTHAVSVECTGPALTHTPAATATPTGTATTIPPTPTETQVPPTPFATAPRATDTPFPCDGQPCTPTPEPRMRSMSSSECVGIFGGEMLGPCAAIRQGGNLATVGASLAARIDDAGNNDGFVQPGELIEVLWASAPQLHALDGSLAIAVAVPSDDPVVFATDVGGFEGVLLGELTPAYVCAWNSPIWSAADEDCDGDGTPGNGIVWAHLSIDGEAPGTIGRVTAWNALSGEVLGDLFVAVVGEPETMDILAQDTDLASVSAPEPCEAPGDLAALIAAGARADRSLVIARLQDADARDVAGGWVRWTNSDPALATLWLPETPSLDLGPLGIVAFNLLCSGAAEGVVTVRAELTRGPIGISLDPGANAGAFDEQAFTIAAIPTPTPTTTFTPTATPGACAGDVDGSGKVTGRDIAIVARALGSSPGKPRWNPAADVNHDGKVSLLDLKIVIKALHAPPCP